jgi:hypothetical protein
MREPKPRPPRLTPMCQRIFDLLCTSRSGLTVGEIIADLYNHGRLEPDSATKCIHNKVMKINRFFEAEGLLLQVRPRGNNRYTVYVGPKSGRRMGFWKSRSKETRPR